MEFGKNVSLDADVLNIINGKETFSPNYVIARILEPVNLDYFKSAELKSWYLQKVNSLVDEYVLALNEKLNVKSSKAGNAVAKVLHDYELELARDLARNEVDFTPHI